MTLLLFIFGACLQNIKPSEKQPPEITEAELLRQICKNCSELNELKASLSVSILNKEDAAQNSFNAFLVYSSPNKIHLQGYSLFGGVTLFHLIIKDDQVQLTIPSEKLEYFGRIDREKDFTDIFFNSVDELIQAILGCPISDNQLDNFSNSEYSNWELVRNNQERTIIISERGTEFINKILIYPELMTIKEFNLLKHQKNLLKIRYSEYLLENNSLYPHKVVLEDKKQLLRISIRNLDFQPKIREGSFDFLENPEFDKRVITFKIAEFIPREIFSILE